MDLHCSPVYNLSLSKNERILELDQNCPQGLNLTSLTYSHTDDALCQTVEL